MAPGRQTHTHVLALHKDSKKERQHMASVQAEAGFWLRNDIQNAFGEKNASWVDSFPCKDLLQHRIPALKMKFNMRATVPGRHRLLVYHAWDQTLVMYTVRLRVNGSQLSVSGAHFPQDFTVSHAWHPVTRVDANTMAYVVSWQFQIDLHAAPTLAQDTFFWKAVLKHSFETAVLPCMVSVVTSLLMNYYAPASVCGKGGGPTAVSCINVEKLVRTLMPQWIRPLRVLFYTDRTPTELWTFVESLLHLESRLGRTPISVTPELCDLLRAMMAAQVSEWRCAVAQQLHEHICPLDLVDKVVLPYLDMSKSDTPPQQQPTWMWFVHPEHLPTAPCAFL